MSFVPKNCKTAVFFANTFERSSNAGYGANVKTESETGVTIGASRLPYATVNGFREKNDCFAVCSVGIHAFICFVKPGCSTFLVLLNVVMFIHTLQLDSRCCTQISDNEVSTTQQVSIFPSSCNVMHFHTLVILKLKTLSFAHCMHCRYCLLLLCVLSVIQKLRIFCGRDNFHQTASCVHVHFLL